MEPALAAGLFEHGSGHLAYLLKERVGDIDALGGTIRSVADGGTVLDPQVVDALMTERASVEVSTLARLTDREREVLAEIAKGPATLLLARRYVFRLAR